MTDRIRNGRSIQPDAPSGMRWIPGGTFRMGADLSYPEEAPAHTVTVRGFWMDEHTVTNGEFAAFAEAAAYVTLAERPLDPAAYPGADPAMLKPGAAVFFMTSGLGRRLSDPGRAAGCEVRDALLAGSDDHLWPRQRIS